jgi:hypothetical protein
MADERRNLKRSKFSYYMRVLDNYTQQVVGYLANISPRGFQLDCSQPIILNKDYTLRLDLTADISERSFIVFSARCRWSRPSENDPFSYDAGFQILNISPNDDVIFQRIVTKYGSKDNVW